jgi:DNA-binding IclR family transcriptional regulator
MQQDQDRPLSMLERGVHVLQAFRSQGGTLSLPELVRRTGMAKATVYRLAETLVELRLLERQHRGYSPGMGLFELGELVPVKLRLRETALPFMQDLYEATHETVHLAVRDDLDVVYAEKIRGHVGVTVPSRVGGRLPLSCTGVGKALLAFADPQVVDAVLSRPLRRLTEHSITDPIELANQLAQIKASGLAYDHEEASLGVSCVASPVLVHGEPLAALSLSVPATQLQPARLAPAVRTVSLALSRLLSQT